ncbi:Conjugal transfer protein TrbH [Maridesulfovibrio ferrireducens]|uniref:Conjugal transfer protein TrbH n=1 Tax=Maridesulfovibrio ferrireducens TaxID=246191 RepID=A0A1G9ENE3_9BACT|nr:TcpQ domain-containing protein [Maridesulfovibrio ferrireducens]SDK77608.1 Conjugal transfer protein TrbH [Maridesulfovibrio ferrireducens]
MRNLIILLLLTIPFTGCTAFKIMKKHVTIAEQTAPMYEEHEVEPLVEEAALKVATHYPPGRTVFHMNVSDNPFGNQFENNLRGQGFQFSPKTTDPNVLNVNQVFDAIGNSTMYYLYIQSSDGWSFGQVYNLTFEGFQKAGLLTQTPAFFEFVGDDSQQVESPLNENWSIVPGGLKNQLKRWAGRAEYQLVWKAGHDFQMQAHATFRDTFPRAVKRMFSRMHAGGNSLRVTIYQANKVIEVCED